MYCLTVLWDQESQIKVWAEPCSLCGTSERLIPGLSLLVSGSSLACGNVTPFFMGHSPCVLVFLQISPFYKDTSHIGLGTHTTPVGPHLN